MTKLTELVEHGFTRWKLEGLYTPGQNFVEIVKLFNQARSLIKRGTLAMTKPSCWMKKFVNFTLKIVSLIQDFMITILIWLNNVNG